jgi:dihydroorotase
LEYKSRVIEALPKGTEFEPLMTLYLTDKTSPPEVEAAKEAGIVAFKLYPAGATTNSDSGVTDIERCLPTLTAMAEVCSSFPLLLYRNDATSSRLHQLISDLSDGYKDVA